MNSNPYLSSPNNHCQYFQNLEQKLLEESNTLTSLMGKSLISDKSTPRLKLALSPTHTNTHHPHHPSPTCINRPSLKAEGSQIEKPYMRRVKELCQKFRQPKSNTESTFKSPSKLILREKYENQRRLAYNISSPKGGKGVTQEKQKVEMVQGSEEAREEKGSRLCKSTEEGKSLKDTISTESCKSFKDRISISICQQRVRLDDFEVIKLLGEGKLGTLFLVRHKASNFLCALKRIPSQHISHDQNTVNQRVREIKIQSYLDHPNIVQLYSVFVEEGELYLLLQLCSSGSLYSTLRQEGQLGEERMRGVVKQVCYAVEYMHDNDILHRDLKPQNILLHESVVKICDFGWSVNSPLLRDTLCGTPLYASPELVQRQHYDNKVDIWNIGILTYELLYGKVPFEVRSEEDLTKIVDDDLYFPRNKPASLQVKDFILHCLSKDPRERFSIAKLIDHEFLNP